MDFINQGNLYVLHVNELVSTYWHILKSVLFEKSKKVLSHGIAAAYLISFGYVTFDLLSSFQIPRVFIWFFHLAHDLAIKS